MRVVYVAGTGRSGSTVFELALAQRLGVPASGELVSVWTRGVLEDRRCSCGDRFHQCPFWRAVMETDPAAFTVDRARTVATETRQVMHAFGPLRCTTSRERERLSHRVSAQWYASMGALHRGVAIVSGSETITDSSKAPVLAWLLQQIDGIDLDLVHLVRDPRAVAQSWAHPHDVPDDVAPMPRLSSWKSAMVWTMVNVAAAQVGRALAGRTVPVRYEDFARAPDVVLDDVLAGLGLDSVDPDRQPIELIQPAAHTMSGNPPVRLRREPFAVAAPVPAGGSGAGPAERTVTMLTAPLLGNYGYPIRRRSTGVRSPSGAAMTSLV